MAEEQLCYSYESLSVTQRNYCGTDNSHVSLFCPSCSSNHYILAFIKKKKH